MPMAPILLGDIAQTGERRSCKTVEFVGEGACTGVCLLLVERSANGAPRRPLDHYCATAALRE